MKLRMLVVLLAMIPWLIPASPHPEEDQDYTRYHEQVMESEKLIVEARFREALTVLEQLFGDYDFLFQRDLKIATQLAFFIGDKEKAYRYLREGIKAGCELKSIRKNKYLKKFRGDSEWRVTLNDYQGLREEYLKGLDLTTRETVRKMFKNDQRKSLAALFRIGNRAQERYSHEKFAPHSVRQMKDLIAILHEKGYPGEQLIGNSYWMSTIISHHNSITREYVSNDTLYEHIKPMLSNAITKGQISPYEYALFDDWYRAVSSGRTKPGYGFVTTPNQSTLIVSNQLRQNIGLRSIELRNQLVELENKTGMNFYLPGWTRGKINID